MGGAKLLDTEDPNIKHYVSKVGEIIILLSVLDWRMQLFIDTIIEPLYKTNVNKPISKLVKGFKLSPRTDFLKKLIESKHSANLEEYLKIHDEIKKCTEIRNTFAHSQFYFQTVNKKSIMLISNQKVIDETKGSSFYKQITINEIEIYIKRFRTLLSSFNSFTYRLGYYQGHQNM